MGRLRGEYVYTCTGPQRPVFLGDGVERACFAVEARPDDVVRVEVSYDPVDVLRKGKGLWHGFDGDMGGGLYGVSGLRLVIERLEAWVSLTVEQDDGDA